MTGDLFGCVCVKRSQDWQEGVTLGWEVRFMRRDASVRVVNGGLRMEWWWTRYGLGDGQYMG